jgi:hypothetical protein
MDRFAPDRSSGRRLTLLTIAPNTPHTPLFGLWCRPMEPQGQCALVVASGHRIAASAPVRRRVTDHQANRGGGMNTRVAPLGLMGLSLLVALVAAARAQAPETVFVLRHCQSAPTWQIAYVRGIVPETVDLSSEAQVQEILEGGRHFITEHCTLPSRPNTKTVMSIVLYQRHEPIVFARTSTVYDRFGFPIRGQTDYRNERVREKVPARENRGRG